MKENKLLKELEEKGLEIGKPRKSKVVVIESEPCYQGNFGYYFIKSQDASAIILKGLFKDFLRVLAGSFEISEATWSELAKALNASEQALLKPIKLRLQVTGGNVSITDCEEYQADVALKSEKRNYKIPRPLSSAEYSQPAGKLYDESVLLSLGFLSELLPNVTSNFLESIFESLPDVLNPIFASCALKTQSPTIINAYGRVYTNLTALEKPLKNIGVSKAMFRLSFAPHLYLKADGKVTKINKKYFNIKYSEISEILQEVREAASDINEKTLSEENFLSCFISLMFVYEYLELNLCDRLGKLLKYFDNVSDALGAIYKTRKNSIFSDNKEHELPKFFDFKEEVAKVNLADGYKAQRIGKYLHKIPFFKRLFGQADVKKLIKEVHKFLNVRDEFFLLFSSFVINSRKTLIEVGARGKRKSRLQNENDIFYLEYEEVNKLLSDSHFTLSANSILLRKWQRERFAAQVALPEIYGEDFDKVAQLSEKMIIGGFETVEYEALALNKTEFKEGVTTSELSHENYAGKIIAAQKLSVADLLKYKSAKAFIVENISPFSPVAEFAVRNDIALYSGVRFAQMLLDGRTVRLDDKIISKIG